MNGPLILFIGGGLLWGAIMILVALALNLPMT